MKHVLRVLIATVVVVTIAVTLRMGYVAWRGAGFEYIERRTGVQLPPGTTEKATHDPYFYFVLGCAKIRDTEIDGFVKRYGFTSTGENVLLRRDYDFGEVASGYQRIPRDGDLVHLSGEVDGLPWHFTLDRATGKLWVDVSYPD